MEIDIKKNQIFLIESLIKANKDKKSSKWERSVFFIPIEGLFIYNDYWMPNEIIFPLINNKILVFNGFKFHQGEKTVEYVIKNENFNISEFKGIDYEVGKRKV